MRTEHVPAPVRPSVPPLFWFTSALWTGILAAEAVSWQVFRGDADAWNILILPAVALAVLLVSLRVRFAVCGLFAAGLMAGALSGGLYWAAWRSDVAAVSSAAHELTVSAPGDAARGKFGSYFLATIACCEDAGFPDRVGGARVQVMCPESVRPIELGQTATVDGDVSASEVTERGRDAHRKGVIARISASDVTGVRWAEGSRGVIGRFRYSAGQRLKAVEGEAGALLAGVTLGDRRGMQGTEAEQDFRTTGLSHLVAVSGSHLVVVAGVFAWALQRTRMRRSISAILLVVVMAAYVVATGVQASAVRAVLMSGAVVLAGLLGRRVDRLATLAAGVSLALIVSPQVAFDAGFQLSVCSVLGLVIYARIASLWAEVILPRFLRIVAEPLSLTVVAQIATLPVAVPLFGVVSLIAPVANLLVGPVVTVVLLVGLAGMAVGVALPAAGRFLLMVAGAAAGLAVDIAGSLARLPNAAVPFVSPPLMVAIAVVGPAALLWAMWPRPSPVIGRLAVITCLLAMMVFSVGPRPSSQNELVVMDVGQGDAVLLKDGGETVLIDTGPSPEALRRALARAGVRRMGLLVLTHRHEDHIGGVDALGVHQGIRTVLVPASRSDEWNSLKTPWSDEGSVRTTEVRAGDSVRVGASLLTVYWPQQEVADAALNESSVVVLVERGETRVLLTGDAEAAELERVAAEIGDIDTLKVGHHGSKGSVSSRLLEVLDPEVAVISVGTGNRFGHPTAETIRLLLAAGCKIRRTDEDGDVHLALDECAKLERATSLRLNGTHERSARRPETCLPHPQRPAHVGGSGSEPVTETGGRDRRPRFQLDDVRCGEHECRRSDRIVQYAAVHERSPPRDRARGREAQQRRSGQVG